jgi:hypothetical protein
VKGGTVADSKAVRPTTTHREVDATEKKGGYPAGDKTAAQMSPPPSSWLRPIADARPAAGNAPATGKK